MMEGSIHQEDIVVLNVYAPYNRLQNTQSKTWQSWQEKQIHPQSQLGISMYSSVIDKASRGKKKKLARGSWRKLNRLILKWGMEEERHLENSKQISPTSQFVLYTYLSYKSENPCLAFTREPFTQTASVPLKAFPFVSPKFDWP